MEGKSNTNQEMVTLPKAEVIEILKALEAAKRKLQARIK